MDKSLRARRMCLEHASDLVASAERVLKDNGFPNIAYHLAILALEEVGKAGMIASRAVVGDAREMEWMDKRFGNHVWKIQWAVWSPGFSGDRIDPKDFEEARRFAQTTHARRLAGLYVNVDDETAIPPRVAVNTKHAKSVLNLARARLALENATGHPVLNEPNDHLRWFLDTVGDEHGRKRIFSKQFIAKHEELKGDTRAWVEWARQEFEKIAVDEQAHLQKELARLPSAPENSRPKWIIKIRLYTPSHTIRPKILSYWNTRMGWAKLRPVGSKNELLLELTLSDSFPIQNVYDIGLSASKLCIAALNIGSLGFFWYELPRQPRHYYESIRDVDAPKMNVAVSRTPGLFCDWKPGALSEKNLHHAIECIAAFGSMSDEEASPIFGPYLQGLVLLAKTDIHLSCEIQARDAFTETLRNSCSHFGDWDGDDDNFILSLHRAFEHIIPELDHRNQLFNFLVPPHRTAAGTFADALTAKRVADLHLVLAADRLISQQIQHREG